MSMWFTAVPPKEHHGGGCLSLRDTCHVPVPEEVSLHFLQSAGVAPSPEDTYKKKEIGFIPPVVSSSQSKTKLTLIENEKKKKKKKKVVKQS